MNPSDLPVVVLPTYNEQENIGQILPDILKQDPRLQVLVVDDSSPDHTADTVRELQKDYPDRIHLTVRNLRGRGSAVLQGLEEALSMGASCLIEMDADFSHNPSDLPRFLKEIETEDVVVGSRFISGGRVEQRGWTRNFLSYVINFVIRLILGLHVRDASSGYRCFRAAVIQKLDFSKILSKNYSLCPEMLYRIKKEGFSLKEIPIVFVNRKAGKSKATLKIAADYLITVLSIRLRH